MEKVTRPKFNLTREQGIEILLNGLSQGDEFWVDLVKEFYDQATNTMPTIYDVLKPLGVTKEEITKGD